MLGRTLLSLQYQPWMLCEAIVPTVFNDSLLVSSQPIQRSTQLSLAEKKFRDFALTATATNDWIIITELLISICNQLMQKKRGNGIQ